MISVCPLVVSLLTFIQVFNPCYKAIDYGDNVKKEEKTTSSRVVSVQSDSDRTMIIVEITAMKKTSIKPPIFSTVYYYDGMSYGVLSKLKYDDEEEVEEEIELKRKAKYCDTLYCEPLPDGSITLDILTKTRDFIEVDLTKNGEAGKQIVGSVKFEDVFTVPKFLGENPNLFTTWVSRNLHYPERSKRLGIEGTVKVKFVISKEGKITDAKIDKSSGDKYLDLEALLVVESSPDWEPGKYRNFSTNTTYTIPVVFKLTGVANNVHIH